MYKYSYRKPAPEISPAALEGLGLGDLMVWDADRVISFLSAAALEAYDRSNLDGLMADLGYAFLSVSEYTGAEKEFRIYGYAADKNVTRTAAPWDLNYDLIGLHKKETFQAGDLVKVEYYGAYVAGEYSIPVLREDRVYTIVNGVYVRRDMTITWFYTDGTECPDKKTTIKYYDAIQGMQGVQSKRENILASAKMNLVYYLIASGSAPVVETAQAMAKEFMRAFPTEMTLYIEGDKTPLIDFLTADQGHAFLEATVPPGGLTIRALLIAEVSQ